MNSRMVQYLGTLGSSYVDSADVSARSCRETFIAGGTLAVGDWVVLDTSKTASLRGIYVIAAPASSVSGGVVGVATEAASAGDQVVVVVKGYCESAKLNTSVALGDSLFCGGTAAGTAETFSQATATVGPCGFALEADTAGVGDVWVCGIY